MALSDKQILEELGEGNIIIEPFNPKNLSSSSYDVTLGMHYYKPCNYKPKADFYNPYSKKDVDKVWKLRTARKCSEVFSCYGAENISKDDYIILIGPGESLLCHTEEFIGGRNNITTMMKSRSSSGRNFLETCSCAGWGDVGYTNRWTMEVRNNSQWYTIPLVVGRRISQIIFLRTGETLNSYTVTGKYQKTSDIDDLKIKWKPEDMLPKMYLDREINESI